MTAVLKYLRQLRIRNPALVAVILMPGWAAGEDRAAPNPGATPMNQLVLAGGNACGPASLVTAFRFGNPSWQQVAGRLPGNTEKDRLWSVIRGHGLRPSAHLNGRMRWSRAGVNVADLADMANEMAVGLYLPGVSSEVLFVKPRETQEQLLRRVHGRLETSMEKGLPPVISLRRFVYRRAGGGAPFWLLLEAHFVTVTTLPKKLERGARSFPVSYIDPWGGKRATGVIAISDQVFLASRPEAGRAVDPAVSPCLEALFPAAAVGKKLVKQGETSVLTLAAVVGRW
jgi:hypothetical protein